eukprot:5199677-Prymnesium_polylepis.1
MRPLPFRPPPVSMMNSSSRKPDSPLRSTLSSPLRSFSSGIMSANRWAIVFCWAVVGFRHSRPLLVSKKSNLKCGAKVRVFRLKTVFGNAKRWRSSSKGSTSIAYAANCERMSAVTFLFCWFPYRDRFQAVVLTFLSNGSMTLSAAPA